MEINGVDLDGLAHEAEGIVFPSPTPGRVVHIDADFLAYEVSYERLEDGEGKSLEDMKHNANVAIETLRLLSGAERVHLHLTPSTSNKGGRYSIALLKQYQGNRVDKPKPRYLNHIRNWLVTEHTGTLHQFCEADDGMSSSQYAAIAEGNKHLSIIASKDKDLAMVPGLHLDWSMGNIIDTEDFGSIWLHERVSQSSGTVTKQLKGFGQSFFWAQMLMGDTADNISGLPKVPTAIANVVSPTKAVTDAFAVINSNMPDGHKRKAQLVLDKRPPIQCGPVMTYNLLKDVKTNKQAFLAVKAMYRLYGEQIGFTHWETGEPVPWNKAFCSEAQLLWMRRNKEDPMDVFHWFKEITA